MPFLPEIAGTKKGSLRERLGLSVLAVRRGGGGRPAVADRPVAAAAAARTHPRITREEGARSSSSSDDSSPPPEARRLVFESPAATRHAKSATESRFSSHARSLSFGRPSASSAPAFSSQPASTPPQAALRHAACTIQAHARGAAARHELRRARAAAVRVQAAARHELRVAHRRRGLEEQARRSGATLSDIGQIPKPRPAVGDDLVPRARHAQWRYAEETREQKLEQASNLLARYLPNDVVRDLCS
jgi:hypothetical protein